MLSGPNSLGNQDLLIDSDTPNEGCLMPKAISGGVFDDWNIEKAPGYISAAHSSQEQGMIDAGEPPLLKVIPKVRTFVTRVSPDCLFSTFSVLRPFHFGTIASGVTVVAGQQRWAVVPF